MEIPGSPPEGAVILRPTSNGLQIFSSKLRSLEGTERKSKNASRVSTLRVEALSDRVTDNHGRVRPQVSRNRGADSLIAWHNMPDVDRETFIKVRETILVGKEAKASPIVLLLYVENSWRTFVNSAASKVLRWLPKSSMMVTAQHRPWFNVLFEQNTRIFCGDFDSLLVSLERTDPNGKATRGLLGQIAGEDSEPHPSIRDEVERNFFRLNGGSNAIAVCLRHAPSKLTELVDEVWAGSDNPKTVLKEVFDHAHATVFGTPSAYATGAKDHKEMIELARTVDSRRVPMPDTSKDTCTLIEEAIEDMMTPPPSHSLESDEVDELLVKTIKSSYLSNRKIGRVPMKSSACPEVGRHAGGFAKAVKLMAASEMDPKDPRRIQILLGDAALPSSRVPNEEFYQELTDLTLTNAFVHTERKLKETIERGWAVGLVTVVRPEATGGKPRVYVAGEAYTAFSQRISRGSLARVNDTDAAIRAIRKGVTPSNLLPVIRAIGDARYTISPDASGATNTMQHKRMKKSYYAAIDRVNEDDLEPWLQDFGIDRVRAYMKMASDVYAMETRMVNSTFYKRTRYPSVNQTSEDFAFESAEFEEPLPQKPYPTLTGRVLGGISEDTCITGLTGSGKSFGLVVDLINNGVLADVSLPRRIAAKDLYEKIKDHFSDDPNLGDAIGIKIGNLEENLHARVVIGTSGALLGRVKRNRIVVMDESHDISDQRDSHRSSCYGKGVRFIDMSATKPTILSHLPDKEISRYDGRVREVEWIECLSMADCVAYANTYAMKRGGRMITITPSIPDACDLASRLRGIRLHGKTPPEEQDAAIADRTNTPVCGTEILTSSITISNAISIAREGYTWSEMYDPIKNITSLGRYMIDKANLEQTAGRVARNAHHDEPGDTPIRGRMYYFLPKKTPELIGSPGDCIARPGYADLSEAEKGCYRLVNPMYLAASMHDAPLSSGRERRVGGPPGVRNLLSKVNSLNGRTIIAECCFRLEDAYAEAFKEIVLGNPSAEEADELRKITWFDYTIFNDPITDLGRKCVERYEMILKRIESPELQDEFMDITNLIAESFPGEVTYVQEEVATWVSRSYSWEMGVKDGYYLCQLHVSSGRLDCRSRRVNNLDFEKKARGCVYPVGGSLDSPVVSVANGNYATECALEVVKGHRAVLDPFATASAQIQTFEDNQQKVYELGTFAQSKHHGSDQSALNSFEFLNHTTSVSLTFEAQKMAHAAFLKNPEPFHAMGVPRVEIPPPTSQRGMGHGYGDDRIAPTGFPKEKTKGVSNSELPDQSLNVLLAMVYISDSVISDKTGRQDTRVPFTLSTFCAHAIEPKKKVHVVSQTRKFLKTFGVDGPGPSSGSAPNWYLISRSVEIDDPGFVPSKNKIRKDFGGYSDLIDAAEHCCSQIPYSTMKAAGRLCRESDLELKDAISLCLSTYPMPAHKPFYRSYKESLERAKSQKAELNEIYDRDESFIDVYGITDYEEIRK